MKNTMKRYYQDRQKGAIKAEKWPQIVAAFDACSLLNGDCDKCLHLGKCLNQYDDLVTRAERYAPARYFANARSEPEPPILHGAGLEMVKSLNRMGL